MFDKFKVGDIIISYEMYNQRYINRIIYIDEHHMLVVQIKSIDNEIDNQDNNKVVTYYKDMLQKHEILTDELALEFL